MTPRYHLVKHTRDYERENRRTGRVVTGMVTTWDVIETAACRLVSEYRTKREAVAAMARLDRMT